MQLVALDHPWVAGVVVLRALQIGFAGARRNRGEAYPADRINRAIVIKTMDKCRDHER